MNQDTLPRMSFQEAFNYMQTGADVKLPDWRGFWRWNEDTKSILLFTAGGEIMDIRDVPDMRFTLNFTFCNDWVKVKSDDQLSPECLKMRAWYDTQ